LQDCIQTIALPRPGNQAVKFSLEGKPLQTIITSISAANNKPAPGVSVIYTLEQEVSITMNVFN